MNICYLDFWPGFDINCNWFNLALKECFNDINIITNPSKADVILASSFGYERYKHKDIKAVKIFYTGENERPDFNFADYSLTFDFDDYDGRNFRLPHWMLYVNWWNEPNFPHARISLEQLNKKWNGEEIYNRPNFCSIIIGNPVKNRLDVARKLNEYKEVHGYGNVFNNFYSGCKVKLLENYRWNICFENSIYKGYVTEKIFEAKVAGCIPIYYGHEESVGIDFNSKCYINVANLNGINQLYDLIYFYENDKNAFLELSGQELFSDRIPNLNELYEYLRKIIEE